MQSWICGRRGGAGMRARRTTVMTSSARRSPAALLVAERDGEIVGALIAAWDGWRGNMYRLAVRDGRRREGVGLALTRAGEGYLWERGVRRVTALVAYDDEVAGAFWEAAGYPLTARSAGESATSEPSRGRIVSAR